MESSREQRTDGDAWQQQLLRRIKHAVQEQMDSELKEVLEKVGALEKWRTEHMNECHPKILYWLAAIVGGVAGASATLGFVLGIVYQWAGK